MAKAITSPIPPSDKAAALALTPVSRETEARLDRYVDLLVMWAAGVGMFHVKQTAEAESHSSDRHCEER
jgi:hypothetical protein